MLEIFRFDLRENPKTGKPQWQARRKGRDGTTCYIVPDESPKFPSYEQDVWLCEIGDPVFVSPDKKFRVVQVRLIAPWPERMKLLFVLGERDEKPFWSASGRVGPVNVTFVVHKDSEVSPDETSPVWNCGLDTFIMAQNRYGIIVPVWPEGPVETELRTLNFIEDKSPEGRDQFACQSASDGVIVRYVVDRGHYLRVKNSGESRWSCVFQRDLYTSPNGLFRVIAVVPVSPVPLTDRGKRRQERREERAIRTAARLEVERESARKRAAERLMGGGTRRSNGGKNNKKAATT